MPTNFEVMRYQTDIPTKVAGQISGMFERNYPESHLAADRIVDIQKRSGATAIRSLLDEGRTLYVAAPTFERRNPAVLGFLESRIIDADPGTYEQISWIMTAREHQRQGIASTLHSVFMHDALLRTAQRFPRPTDALLSVHAQNPAKTRYQRWGYQEVERTSANMIVMTQSLTNN